MSKIEEFKKEKDEHDSMTAGLLKCQNLAPYQDNRRDKFGVAVGSKWHEHGEPMGYLTAYSGFYGSSSCSAYDSKRMAKYVQWAINKMMPQISKMAIALSEKDVEDKRLAAEDEAKSVLEQTLSK